MQTRLWPDRRTLQSPDSRLGISETARRAAGSTGRPRRAV